MMEENKTKFLTKTMCQFVLGSINEDGSTELCCGKPDSWSFIDDEEYDDDPDEGGEA